MLGLHALAGSGAIASDLGPFTTSGSIWVITFTVQANAPNGTTVLNLAQKAMVNSGFVTTNISQVAPDTPASYTLDPAPSNTPGDPTDGSITVSSAG